MSAVCVAEKTQTGYKQTEIGFIPEDWNYCTFGYLYAEPSRNGIYKTSEFHGRGTRIVNMGEMFGFEFISDQEMTRVELTNRELVDSSLQDGDLLFGRRSVVPAGAGKCSLVLSPLEPITFESSIIRVRLKIAEAHPPFYYYFFASPIGRSLVGTIVAGTNVKGIRATELRELKVPIPTKTEQKAIAETLSDADALIESLEQLIAKKRQIKQGAMQELLTGKSRLPGFTTKAGYKHTELGVVPDDWLDHTVGELIDFEGGSQPDKRVFSSTLKPGYVRLIQIRDYKTDKYETYVPTNLARRFCTESDIMIGRYGPPIFQILRGLSGAYNVALIKAKPRPQINLTYAYYFLKQDKLFEFIDKLSQRSSGQTGIDLKELRSYPLPLPPTITEQEAIASILYDMDSEITALEEKLAKTRQIKQGMMQELLTGKIRLI